MDWSDRCPICRMPISNYAWVCPHCTRDISDRYERRTPMTPAERGCTVLFFFGIVLFSAAVTLLPGVMLLLHILGH